MKPKYRVGEKVYHTSRESYGVVACIINGNDMEDVFEQGFRYEVDIKGVFWSVLEEDLVPKKIRKPSSNSKNYTERVERHD